MQSATILLCRGHSVLGFIMRLQYEWKCPYCPEILQSRRQLQRHKLDCHHIDGKPAAYTIADRTCQYCGTILSTTTSGIANHELRCKHNPNRKPIKNGSRAFTQTPEFRAKCSERMKRRHDLGIAPTYQNRKHVKHSYPELWLIGLLFNKYGWTENVDYKTELPFHGYYLDFSWPDKRLCIELDGDLHRYENQQKSDENKDRLLHNDGWLVLRVKWGYILTHKQEFGVMLDNFLSGCGDVTVPLYKTRKERIEDARLRRHQQGVEQNCLGWDCVRKVTHSEWNARKQKIIDSNVDLTTYGWMSKVAALTGMSRQQIYKVVNHFDDLKSIVYIRKPNGTCMKPTHNPKYEHGKISETEYERRLQIILNTGVDFNSVGWRKFLITHTGFSRKVITTTLDHYAPKFNYRKCTKHLDVGELVDPPA